VVTDSTDWGIIAMHVDHGDAAFIARAHQDVPALCDEVEALREQLMETQHANVKQRKADYALGYEDGAENLEALRAVAELALQYADGVSGYDDEHVRKRLYEALAATGVSL
jgi:hypothetical protein